jgi:hypothetical protein
MSSPLSVGNSKSNTSLTTFSSPPMAEAEFETAKGSSDLDFVIDVTEQDFGDYMKSNEEMPEMEFKKNPKKSQILKGKNVKRKLKSYWPFGPKQELPLPAAQQGKSTKSKKPNPEFENLEKYPVQSTAPSNSKQPIFKSLSSNFIPEPSKPSKTEEKEKEEKSQHTSPFSNSKIKKIKEIAANFENSSRFPEELPHSDEDEDDCCCSSKSDVNKLHSLDIPEFQDKPAQRSAFTHFFSFGKNAAKEGALKLGSVFTGFKTKITGKRSSDQNILI